MVSLSIVEGIMNREERVGVSVGGSGVLLTSVVSESVGVCVWFRNK